MSIKSKIRIRGIIDMSVNSAQLSYLLKLLKDTEGRLGPIIDDDYNPWGGKKIREFIQLAPAMRNRTFLSRVLTKTELARVRRFKVVEGLDGGMEPLHMHVGSEVFLLDQSIFDRLVFKAQVDMSRLKDANSIG